jgi:glycosyltransferase involved in cell wall biosynthesis
MKHPKISIVMPSYNQASFIEEAIESILSQSYSNFELIIVDGLSTDGTIEKLLKYESNSHVKKIIIEKDKGQTDALYKGFQYCSGDIYAWLNSDDSFTENAFQHVVNVFHEHSEIDVINGESNVVDENSNWIAKWPRRKLSNRQWLHCPQPISQPSTFFTSSIFKMVGAINPKYNYAMDYDLFLRFALAGAKFWYSDVDLANFRVHSKSKTMALPYKFWREEIKVYYTLSNKRLFSGFYYWKFRGIFSTIIKEKVLKSRKF